LNETTSTPTARDPHPRDRVLVVADWGIDPEAVIAACERRDIERPSSFALVVPAWLHGIDWAGDPLASVPCARAQVASITRLADVAGRRFASAQVGDPEPVAAISDVLADWPADEVLVCSRPPLVRLPRAFDLIHRARRATGLPLRREVLPDATARPRGRVLTHRGHCTLQLAAT
jgi:hypothetical protein